MASFDAENRRVSINQLSAGYSKYDSSKFNFSEMFFDDGLKNVSNDSQVSEKAEKTYTYVYDDSESTGTIFEENWNKILEKFEKVVRHNSSIK